MVMEVDSNSKFLGVPIVIEIVLYTNNYFDNRILKELKKNAYIMKTEREDIISVTAKDFKRIISTKFKEEISAFSRLTVDTLGKKVNSIYFLDNMLSKLSSLELINIIISKNRAFSRIATVENVTMITFDFKVNQGVLDYPKYLNDEQLKRFNKLLEKINVRDKKTSISLEPYYVLTAREYITRLVNLERTDSNYTSSNSDIFKMTYEMVEPKIEEDNSHLLIKTDF